MSNVAKGSIVKGNKGTRKGNKGDASPVVPVPTFNVGGVAYNAGTIVPNIARGEGKGDVAYFDRATRIVALWGRLRDTHTRDEGKRFRRALRALGHFGGMRHEKGTRVNVPIATNVVNGERPPLGTLTNGKSRNGNAC